MAVHVGVRGPGHLSRTGVAASAAVAPFQSINADGFSMEVASPAAGPALLTPHNLTRTGYDSAGALETRVDARVMNYRRRGIYPNDGSLTAHTVTGDTWFVSNDAASGVTNNSALVSPAPVCAWSMIDRDTIGNTLNWSMTVYHWAARVGKQVACVKVIATDVGAAHTVTQTVTSTSATLCPNTGWYVEEYTGSLDITTLNSGLITLNGEAYPWVAASDGSSIAKSTNSSVNREFSPRHFRKDLERCVGGTLGPPTAIVDGATGNDSTGTWGTSASPGLAFATPQGAINIQSTALRSMTVAGYANNNLDGAQLLCKAGTYVLAGATTTRAQDISWLRIGRHSSTSTASDVVIQMTSWRARLGVTGMTLPSNEGGALFDSVKVQRTGAGTFSGEAGSDLEVFFRNCLFDNGSVTSAFLTSSSNDLHVGTTFSNLAGSVLGSAGGVDSTEHRMFRDCIATGAAIDHWLVLGCSFVGCNVTAAARTNDGSIVASTAFYGCTGETWAVAGVGGFAITKGAFLVNSLIEAVHTTSALPGIGISRDGSTLSTVQVGIIGCTIVAAGSLGRANEEYCDKGATGAPRTHTFTVDKGNIYPGRYVKGDQFVATNNNGSPDTVNAPDYFGHLPHVYGVNEAGNVQMWQTSANGLTSAEGPIYQGAGSLRPAPGVVTELSVSFVDPKQTTFNGTVYTAGAGSGDYRLNVGSIALGILAEAVLGYTIDGAVRAATNDNAGARKAA